MYDILKLKGQDIYKYLVLLILKRPRSNCFKLMFN